MQPLLRAAVESSSPQMPERVDPPAALHHLLRLGLVAPEIGCGGARFYFAELCVEVGSFKDASAARARVCSDPRNAVSDLRLRQPPLPPEENEPETNDADGDIRDRVRSEEHTSE